MPTEAEIQAGAKAIALNCASVNCLRFLADGDCASKDDCVCRQDSKIAIEAAEKVRSGVKTNDQMERILDEQLKQAERDGRTLPNRDGRS